MKNMKSITVYSILQLSTFIYVFNSFVCVESLPIQKYQPYRNEGVPLPYNVKCYNMHNKTGSKPEVGINPGVYIFFENKYRAIYVGKAIKDIWAEMTTHFDKGYNRSERYSEVCYVALEPNFPPAAPVIPYKNYSPYIIESLMLSTFCFDSNYVDNGGNALKRHEKPSNLIPIHLANYRCDAGLGDVLERLSFLSANIHNIAHLLYNVRGVTSEFKPMIDNTF